MDRVPQLSLDEEALCVAVREQQVGDFRIGGSVNLQCAISIGARFVQQRAVCVVLSALQKNSTSQMEELRLYRQCLYSFLSFFSAVVIL